MDLVMVDSHVLTWAVKEKAIPEQKQKIEHAQHLLRELDRKKDKVVISTVVVSELLRDVEIDKQLDLYEEIQKRFIILSFCNRSALECAKISKTHDDKFKKNGLKDTHSNTAVKADWMILSTALVNSVNTLYTDDKSLQNMAKLVEDRIDVKPIPEPFREDIFDPPL